MTETAFDPQRFLRTLTTQPGVYRMLDGQGRVIYVGKARNLKRRVASYFQRGQQPAKTRLMLEHVGGVEVTVTHTEAEALILENNLIKEHRPRFNVLLRDDKSYPYIHLSDHAYPRLSLYRGAKRSGRYFGPYPSVGAVRETLNLLQKLFQLRPCTDTFFNNRTRPCLQYQIKRCSAPCVKQVSESEYRRDVEHAIKFLEGRNAEVIDAMVGRMEQASANLDFERAAQYRDQISALRAVQERQYVDNRSGDVDLVALASQGEVHCVAVMFVRGGRNLGTRTFFPRASAESEPAEVLGAFLSQYYLEREVPREILVNHAIEDAEFLGGALAERAGHKVDVRHRLRGERARWMDMARRNAEQARATRLAADATLNRRYEALAAALELDEPPTRLECFDISHTMGEATVASCVVFGREGPIKADYRRFNIEGIEPGDDYAAMHQALTRRYTRLKKGEGVLPDILFIDGGKGQLREASDVLQELGVDGVLLVGVAKGPTRRPGLEQLFTPDRAEPIQLPPGSPALHLIQQIRDEAHRFAITGHRQRRAKARKTSRLEEIPGLGPKRRSTLLKQFAGLQGVARAGVEDLAAVKGISRALAQRIYDAFHVE